MSFALAANTRPVEKVGANLKADRAARRVPAVIYGNKVANQSLFLDYNQFEKMYRAAGESNLIDLTIDGSQSTKVLVHDVQRNPLTGMYSHVDFYQVNMKEKVHASIPLNFIGVSSAVKDMAGTLVRTMDEVKVKCLPGDLIPHIDVDISVLADFDKSIRVSDLKVPASFEVESHADETVASVDRPRSDAEMAALNEEVKIDVSAIEKVEGKKKEEDAEEGDKKDEKKEDKKEEKK